MSADILVFGQSCLRTNRKRLLWSQKAALTNQFMTETSISCRITAAKVAPELTLHHQIIREGPSWITQYIFTSMNILLPGETGVKRLYLGQLTKPSAQVQVPQAGRSNPDRVKIPYPASVHATGCFPYQFRSH